MTNGEGAVYSPVIGEDTYSEATRHWGTPPVARIALVGSLLEPISQAQAQREFGRTKDAEFRLTIDRGWRLGVDDVYRVLQVDGDFVPAGTNLIVLDYRDALGLDAVAYAVKKTNDGPVL